MRQFVRLLIITLAFLAAAPARAALPPVLFEHGEWTAAEGAIRVHSGLLQLELAPGAVLSAASGSEFRIGANRELDVLAGEVRIVATAAAVVFELAPGRYVFDAQRLSVQASPATTLLSAEPAVRELDYRQPVTLADRAMLMQNEALKFETEKFIRSLFGVLRGLTR